MPLFGTKFSPKNLKIRKSSTSLHSEEPLEDLVGENRCVKLRLGDQDLIFENGSWVPESGTNGNVHKSNQKLKNRIHDLEEENNFLKIKFEVLLDMLTKSTAENQLQQQEIEKLQKYSSKNKQRQ